MKIESGHFDSKNVVSSLNIILSKYTDPSKKLILWILGDVFKYYEIKSIYTNSQGYNINLLFILDPVTLFTVKAMECCHCR